MAAAAAGAAAALAITVGQASAAPIDPTVVASPSSGLTAGQTITVSATGFAPSTPLLGSQCALLPPSAGVRGNVVCDAETGHPLRTDASGATSFQHTVRMSFMGYDADREPWGPVDCVTYSCAMGVTDPSISGMHIAPITFK